MIIGSWNIRGLNDPSKSEAVKGWVKKYKINIFAINETRVRQQNEDRVRRSKLLGYGVVTIVSLPKEGFG